ncbi:MAG: hypothetical protein O2930_05955 [Acidobacteria bacterium]|nr:hypothetical protein [Acidobacteriota bacterium]
MKLNWPVALLSALCIVPALTLVPNGQQEASAQYVFAQTMEECRLAGPGYTQEFMCADGEKLRLYSSRPFLIGHYIEVVPDALVEWNPVTNSAVRRMKLKAGGDAEWSDRLFSNGVSKTRYLLEEKAKGGSLKSDKSDKSTKSGKSGKASTTSKPSGKSQKGPVLPPATFSMTTHFGVITSSTFEDVPCPNCSGGGYGSCQNARTLACAPPSASGACPRRFSKCTATLTVEKDTMLLSATLANWEFQDAGNVLRYRVRLRIRKDTGVFWTPGDERAAFTWPEGFLERPITALISGADGTQRVIDVGVTQTFRGRDDETQYLDFEFPSWAPGEKLYYN